MQTSRKLIALFILILLIQSACNLPNGPAPSNADQEATAVQQTVEALNTQQGAANAAATHTPTLQSTNAGGEAPSSTPNASPTNTQTTPTNQPTATQKPTATNPSVVFIPPGITFGVLNQSVTDVYYGACGQNEPTTIGVSIQIDPLAQVSSATLYYEIASHSGSWGPYTNAMILTNLGEYSGEVDIGTNALTSLVDTGGWANIWVEAIGKDGKTYTSGYYGATIIPCQTGVLGPPATLPFISYFTGPLKATAGDQVTLYWEVFDAACGVYLDGVQVQDTGSYTYTLPLQGNPSDYVHMLEAQGEPCNNPNFVIETVLIQISEP